MCAVCFLGMLQARGLLELFSGLPSASLTEKDVRAPGGLKAYLDETLGDCPEELAELFEKNEEAHDYVLGYPEREEYRNSAIDLSGELVQGEVPLLMQWDRRWGYDDYGSSMIGLAGCGPVCLDMAYLYFTQDTEMSPREMAEFACSNGFYTEAGTSWSLWTEGAAMLGLEGAELPLDENAMKRALDAGGLIVCSMRPGDFTTTGHFILIRGYDSEGFYVNDPNRRSNSGKVWGYERLSGQIKNLWVLQNGTRQGALPPEKQLNIPMWKKRTLSAFFSVRI